MSEFVDTELEKIVFEIVSNGEYLSQEDIAMRIDESLKNRLCNKPHPLSAGKFYELNSIPEGRNNLYRLIHFIKNFCNKPSGETCDLDEIKGVVNELPSNDEGIEDDINELMGQLNLGGGKKKKKKMKGGNPELLKNALHIIHKGVLTLKDKTGEALEALDQTIVNIFKIADHVINNFDAFEALGCVRLFMSTLIGEKLSKILESMLVGGIGIGSVAVAVRQAPQYVKYIPTILKYVATGGVVLTSSTVCFYIGDYVTNLSTLAADKYEKLTEKGQKMINDLAEQVEKSQEGKVESATESIEKYNATVAELANKLKTLPPEDLIVLTTIENTDGEKESSSMAVATTEEDEDENEGAGEKESANGEEEEEINEAAEEEEEEEEANGEDGDAVEEEAVEAAVNDNKRKKREEEEEAAVNDNKRKKREEEGGGKKKKKGRTTQKKKKGTKGKKKASKSKKPKTKKNRKTKKKIQ